MCTWGVYLNCFVLFFTQKYDCFLSSSSAIAGRLSSIRQEKDEVTSINMNAECGLSVTDQTFEFEEGDRIESYDVIEKKTPVHWMF